MEKHYFRYDWKDDTLGPKTGVRRIEYETDSRETGYKNTFDFLD